MPRSLFDLSTPQPFETLADLLATTGLPDGQLGVVEGSDDVLYMWSAFFNEQFGEGWLELATTTRATAWHTGEGAPGADLGNENDYYVDELTQDVYSKVTVSEIASSQKISQTGAAGASSFTTTATMTPTVDALELAAVMLDGSSSPTMTSLTGCGLTWVLVAQINVTTEFSIAVFRAMESSGLSSGALTGNFTGTATSYGIHVFEFTGTITGGSQGDTAIVQSGSDSGSPSGGGGSVTLAAFSDPTHNATFATFAEDSSILPVGEAGYTYVRGHPDNVTILTEYILAADSSPSASWTGGGGTDSWGGIAVEIASAAVPVWTLVGTIASSAASKALFGDGSDGSAAFNGVGSVTGASGTGPYTLTRNVYYTDCTISAGVTVITAGWQIFCTGTLTNAGTIHNDGGAASGTTAGAAAAGGLYGGGTAGAAGLGSGTSTTGGGNGTNVATTGWHNIGAAGGTGGNSNGGTGGTTRAKTPVTGYHDIIALVTGLVVTPSTVDPSSGNTPVVNHLAGGSGGGAGGRTTGGTATTSGAGGGGAGIVVICAYTIDNSAGVIRANGGNGGNAAGGTCVTGGGAGGGGGALVLAFSSLTAGTETANGGTKGTGLNGAAAAADGTAGRVVKCAV